MKVSEKQLLVKMFVLYYLKGRNRVSFKQLNMIKRVKYTGSFGRSDKIIAEIENIMDGYEVIDPKNYDRLEEMVAALVERRKENQRRSSWF